MVDSYDHEELLALIEGGLDPERERSLREVLAIEPALLAVIDELRADRELLASAEVPSPPGDLMSRLEPFLARPMLMDAPEDEFQRRHRSAPRLWPRYVAAAGIGAGLIAGTFTVISMMNSPSNPDGVESTVAINDADQNAASANNSQVVNDAGVGSIGTNLRADAPDSIGGSGENDTTRQPVKLVDADGASNPEQSVGAPTPGGIDGTALANAGATTDHAAPHETDSPGVSETVVASADSAVPRIIDPIIVPEGVVDIPPLTILEDLPVPADFALVLQARDVKLAMEALTARVADIKQICLVDNRVGGNVNWEALDALADLEEEDDLGGGTITDRVRRAQKRLEERRRLARELEGAESNIILGTDKLAPTGLQQRRYLDHGAQYTLTIPASQLKNVLAALSLNEKNLRIVQRRLGESKGEEASESAPDSVRDASSWLEYAAIQRSIGRLLELEDDRLIHLPISFEVIAEENE